MDSKTVFVSSSTNSGTPSVLARICSSRLGGERLPAGELGDDGTALRARELGEVQRRDMAVPRPARRELRPMREHDQQRDGSHPVDQQIEHFQAGGIGPVRILEQHHGGVFAGGRFGEIDQRSQRFVLVFLWRHRERPVARPHTEWTTSRRGNARPQAAGHSG